MDVTAEGDLDLRPFHQLEGAKTVIAIDPAVPGCVLLRIGDIEVGLLNIFDEQRVVRYEHVAAGSASIHSQNCSSSGKAEPVAAA